MHIQKPLRTRIDVYETLCPQQMLVHKGGKIKNWGGECRDVTPTKSLSQSKYQGRCEQRSEVFVKTFFFFSCFFLGGGGGGGSGRGGGGSQGGCEQRIEVFVKIKKKKLEGVGEGGRGGLGRVGGGGGQGGCE